MRILVLNADYPRFLGRLYGDNPGLANASFADQLAVRNDSLFGVADFYSRNFRAHGHDAWEIHLNNPWLQAAWARDHGITAAPPPDVGQVSSQFGFLERGFAGAKSLLRPLLRPLRSRYASRGGLTGEEKRIFLAQVEHYRPDIILNQEMSYVRDGVLRDLRRKGILIVGQIASALPQGECFDSYDLVISSLPNFVEWFRARGVRAELNRLAFEPSVLDMLGPAPNRDVDVSFIGSLSPDHGERIALLEMISAHVKLQLWGNGIERLPKSSSLWRCYRGEAWGRDMYEALRRSRITINHHIDLSEGYANNMRLYEATGAGTLMLVDQKRNLREIFEPGEEVMAYTSPQDCIQTIDRLLRDEPMRARIAANGQARTLAEHNYFRRTGEIISLTERLKHESGN